MAEKKLTDVTTATTFDSVFVNSGGTVRQVQKTKLIDSTLTNSGTAADAKATGDKIKSLETALSSYVTDISSLVGGDA